MGRPEQLDHSRDTPARPAAPERPNWTGRLLVAAPFVSTGAALVAYILSGLSLPVGVVTALAATGATALIAQRRLPPAARRAVGRRAARGALAGLAATAAYDGCRLVVVTVFGLTFWPFDVFTRFGHVLVGGHAPSAVVALVGFAFHYLNGVGFGAAYTLFVRRPRIATGLVWAAILETFMVSLYPGWLGLRALDEFVSVSIVGHVAYGVVLGTTARVLLRDR